MLTTIIPSPYQVEVSQLRQQLDRAHFAWAIEWKARQAAYRIENIRFLHDPDWDKRFFSLQAARNGQTWFWRATHIFVGWTVTSI